MPDLLRSCLDHFGTDNLYKVLNVKEDASDKMVKKAYYKRSLQVHPDRVSSKEKEKATEKFQILGKVYNILSDEDKRALYDESGEINDEDDIPEDKNWYDYWRLVFAKISAKDVKNYEDKYRGSKEELADLKAAYLESEGDMDRILDSVLCSTIDDEPRFVEVLKDLIKTKAVPNFPAFSKESKSKKKQRKEKFAEEAVEAEKAAVKLGLTDDSDDSVRALIKKRQASREAASDDFFAHLEAKYGGPAKKPKPKPGNKKKSTTIT